jgi:glucose dehydrogenase
MISAAFVESARSTDRQRALFMAWHGVVVRTRLAVTAVCCVVAFGAVYSMHAKGVENGEWRNYSGDNGSTKYSPLSQINADNIATLRIDLAASGR